MAGKIVPSAHTSVSALASSGYATVGSSVGFIPSARVWLSSTTITLAYTGRGTSAFSGTVTGGTSGATATVVSDSLAGGSSGSGTLTLSGVTGTFQTGETLTGSVAGSATAAGPQALTPNNQYCQVTDVPDSTHVGLRALTDPGTDATTGSRVSGPNYGKSNLSSFSLASGAGSLDQEDQLIYITAADNTLPVSNPQ